MPDDFTPDDPQDPELAEKLALLRTFSQQALTKPRRCIFRFGLSPVAIRGQGRVKTIDFAQQPSSAVEDIDCGLVFRSVGRRTAPLAGVPYDERAGRARQHRGARGRWLL